MTLPLIEYLDRQMALVDSICASLAARKASRPARSERSRKGWETRRGGLAPAFGTALSPCGSSPAVSPASPLQSTGAQISTGEQR